MSDADRPARCELVGLERSHLPLIRGWLDDGDLRDRVGVEHHPGEQEHERWYERIVADPQRWTQVIVDDLGGPQGLAGFHQLDRRQRRAEVFLYLGTGLTRRRGMGRAAMAALLDVAFLDLGLHRVDARVFEFNDVARSFFLAMGFTHEGIERDGVFARGRYFDVWRFGLLERDRR